MISGKQIKDNSISLAKLLADGDLSFDGYRLSDIGLPLYDSDAANKIYVDSLKESLVLKEAVKVATTSSTELQNIDNTSFVYNGESAGEGTDFWSNVVNPKTIDGISIIDGDRILIKDATNKRGNGIWVYNDSTSKLFRAPDANNIPAQPGFNEVRLGIFVFVVRGTANKNSGWLLVQSGSYPSADTGVYDLGTDELTFMQFTGAGSIIAGTAMSKNVNTLNVNTDGTTIGVDADALYLLANAVSTEKILDGAVTNDKIALSSIESDNIVDGTIIGTDIAEGTITSSNLDVSLFLDITENTAARHVHDNKSVLDGFELIGSPGKLSYEGVEIGYADTIESEDRTIYCSLTGNDTTGDGTTPATAFMTVTRALQDIADVISGATITIVITAGLYSEFDEQANLLAEVSRITLLTSTSKLVLTGETIVEESLSTSFTRNFSDPFILDAASSQGWTANAYRDMFLSNSADSSIVIPIASNGDDYLEISQSVGDFSACNQIHSLGTIIDNSSNPTVLTALLVNGAGTLEIKNIHWINGSVSFLFMRS